MTTSYNSSPPTPKWCCLFISYQILKVKGNVNVCSCYDNLAMPRESPTTYFHATCFSKRDGSFIVGVVVQVVELCGSSSLPQR